MELQGVSVNSRRELVASVRVQEEDGTFSDSFVTIPADQSAPVLDDILALAIACPSSLPG
jgi:hypothetical protein